MDENMKKDNMKKFKIKIDLKEVCEYKGTEENPLDNTYDDRWAIGLSISKTVTCEKLTADIIIQAIEKMLYSKRKIKVSELAGNKTYLTFDRLEDFDSNEVIESNVDCYFATYFISATEILPEIDFTEIEGIENC